MLIQSLVVTDPVGTRLNAADRVLHRRDYDEDVSDNQLRVDLNDIISTFIQKTNGRGWACRVIDEPGYEWRKRLEVLDEYGRLRAVRDFAVIAAWEGEI